MSDLYLSFPFHLKSDDSFLDTKEVYQKLKWMRVNYPDFKAKNYPGIDNFDERINQQLNLEPYLLPDIENQITQGPLKYSVVIPTYNFKNYIINTVRHLFLQDFNAQEFEVIVVDDGSTDGTEEIIKQELSELIKKYNFKYIYFPRTSERTMGDGAFRAGIARNLGVKHARGEYVCFLDSDILTDKSF